MEKASQQCTGPQEHRVLDLHQIHAGTRTMVSIHRSKCDGIMIFRVINLKRSRKRNRNDLRGIDMKLGDQEVSCHLTTYQVMKERKNIQ